MPKIVISMAQCKKCKVVLISAHRHDYRTCKCGAIMLDGGRDYIRSGGDPEDINLLTITLGDDGYLRFPSEE